jgi:hypothetical protein
LREDYANLDVQVNTSKIENQALMAQLKILTQLKLEANGASHIPKISAAELELRQRLLGSR